MASQGKTSRSSLRSKEDARTYPEPHASAQASRAEAVERRYMRSEVGRESFEGLGSHDCRRGGVSPSCCFQPCCSICVVQLVRETAIPRVSDRESGNGVVAVGAGVVTLFCMYILCRMGGGNRPHKKINGPCTSSRQAWRARAIHRPFIVYVHNTAFLRH